MPVPAAAISASAPRAVRDPRAKSVVLAARTMPVPAAAASAGLPGDGAQRGTADARARPGVPRNRASCWSAGSLPQRQSSISWGGRTPRREWVIFCRRETAYIMRALKIVGIVAAALIAVALLGATAVLLLVNPNDYRADIQRLAEQRTGRRLEIGGQLQLKLFPWLAISVGEVKLGNPPSFGPEP